MLLAGRQSLADILPLLVAAKYCRTSLRIQFLLFCKIFNIHLTFYVERSLVEQQVYAKKDRMWMF